MDTLISVTVDRTAFEVTSLFDESSEKRYWLAQTPYERLRAVELMRQIIRASGRHKDLNDLEHLP